MSVSSVQFQVETTVEHYRVPIMTASAKRQPTIKAMLARSRDSTYLETRPAAQLTLIQASYHSTSMRRLVPVAFARQGVLRLGAAISGVDTPRGRAP